MSRNEKSRRGRRRRGTSRRHAELFQILMRKRADLTRLLDEQRGYRLQEQNPPAMATRGDEGEIAARALTVAVESDVMDRRVRMVKQVDFALRRLAEGAYGFCVDCDEPINVERLRSLPFALRCRACQEMWEAAEDQLSGPRLLAGGSLPSLEDQLEVIYSRRELP